MKTFPFITKKVPCYNEKVSVSLLKSDFSRYNDTFSYTSCFYCDKHFPRTCSFSEWKISISVLKLIKTPSQLLSKSKMSL